MSSKLDPAFTYALKNPYHADSCILGLLFFFFPETDHWGKDKFRKNSKTLSNSQIGA